MQTIRRLAAAAAALGLAAALAACSPPPQRSYVNPSLPSGDGGPFSGAVLAGDTLYLSGMLGLEDGRVPEDPEDEARIVLEAMRATLEQAGMGMDDLVSVQVFCSDVAHYDAFNRIYRTFFTREFPARAFLGSGPLLFDARFEVQGVAVRRPAG